MLSFDLGVNSADVRRLTRLHARVLAIALVAGSVLVASSSPAAEQAKGLVAIPIEPLPKSVRSEGNVGVFVGVNRFDADSSLAPLRFAVNDAIGQAHMFVEDLKLVAPENCFLMVGGEPTTDKARDQLRNLTSLGVRPQSASRSAVFAALLQATDRPMSDADMLVFSISTHGFEENGVAYVMPQDGARALLTDMGISLLTVQERIARSGAGKKLLVVDACREVVEQGGKSGPGNMGDAFMDAFSNARGMSVLLSCSRGQFSIERPDLGHGVFTYHLLRALGGDAPADDRGYITLGSIADYLKGSVPEWVRKAIPGIAYSAAQQPSFKEEAGNARAIPLAVSSASAEKLRMIEKRRSAALDAVVDLRRKHRDLVTLEQQGDIEKAIDGGTGRELEALLAKIEKIDTGDRDDAELFLSWWESRGKFVPKPSPQAVRPGGGTARVVAKTSTACAIRIGDGAKTALRPDQALSWEALSAGTTRVTVEARGSTWEQNVEFEQDRDNLLRVMFTTRWSRPAVVVARMNSLGMELLPVPKTTIRMARAEVTNADFRRFRPAHSSGTYEGQTLDEDRQPVVMVSWQDAVDFCQWLTGIERAKGLIGASEAYRLPTDAEWSAAALLKEATEGTPAEKDGKVLVWYPWGPTWPPPKNAGNFSDETAKRLWGHWTTLANYDDGFAVASPVGRFDPNPLGLHDLGGNALEWCADVYKPGEANRVIRGAAWNTIVDPKFHLASDRGAGDPNSRYNQVGFRVVLDPGES